MSTGKGRPLARPPHKNSKAAPLQPGDKVGAYTYAQLLRIDRRYVAAAEEAIRLGLERRTSAFAEQRTGASDRARGIETGIYGATLRWARIGVIMVVCSWHDALGADQLPREIVGNWCSQSSGCCRRRMPIGAAKTAGTTSSCARMASTRRRPVAKSTGSGVKARPGGRAFAARVLG
jgi:hypothetical protein